MKMTRIPAQMTTVEDRIAGNLTLTQILLLLAPLFVLSFVYAVLPQKMHFTLYKIPILIGSSVIFVTLSIRVKGKIILHWVGVLSSYFLRPKIFVFNKNTQAYHASYIEPETILQNIQISSLDNSKSHKLSTLIRDTDESIHIRFKNGGLDVVSH